MNDFKNRLYELQHEIMDLGVQFSESTKDLIGNEDYRIIKAYFEANEYGEALHLVNWIRENNSLNWEVESDDILKEIQDLTGKVKHLYKLPDQ